MSLSASTSRPGPLCEWPLDHFMPSSSNSVLTKLSGTSRPNKRPLSPGGPSLFSPTKRRILTQEGIFSPEKTTKGTFRGAGPSFGELLRESSCAIKKLESGPETSSFTGPSTPLRAPSHRLAPSPELVPTTTSNSTPRRTFDDDDFFATPDRLSSSRLHQSPAPLFALAPRELPPLTDPQSDHYPGFAVHRDAHTIAMNSDAIESGAQEDQDEWKENVIPRRKLKKAISDPVDTKPRLTAMTPEAKKLELEKLFKAKSTPATPRKTASREWYEVTSPTPRRIGLHSKAGTPMISEEERKQRRRLLRDEVEESGAFDDNEDT